MIYETTTRPREVLEARIELWNGNTSQMLRHFEKMIDKCARMLNIQKRSVHQTEWQGVPSDHVNGTEGGRREAP
ncbi:MAG: hypothetical protein MUO76_09025 [Anaerolineaceae bacterium]|nr:hypothetical protein [Anaerolineaceae bacterium]